jgi:hypothetical protein
MAHIDFPSDFVLSDIHSFHPIMERSEIGAPTLRALTGGDLEVAGIRTATSRGAKVQVKLIRR